MPRRTAPTPPRTGLFFLQQLSGINAVVFFSNAIFRQAGIASDTLASATVGLVNVLGTFAASIARSPPARRSLAPYSTQPPRSCPVPLRPLRPPLRPSSRSPPVIRCPQVLDKFGRKPMLAGSFSGMFLAMAVLSAASLPALSVRSARKAPELFFPAAEPRAGAASLMVAGSSS